MDKRVLTLREEQAIRLCHHDFQGLTQTEAAMKLGVSQQRLSQLLQTAEKKAPQMFPILPPLEGRVYKMVVEVGAKYEEIAKLLGVDLEAVYNAVRELKNKGFNLSRPTVERFRKELDSHSLPERKF